MAKGLKKFKDDMNDDYTSRNRNKDKGKPSYHKGTSPRNTDDDEYERTTKFGGKKSNSRRK